MKKILIACLIIYACYLFSALFGGAFNKRKPEMHLLPKGFIGRVYVFFNESEGLAKEYKDGFRVYRIPKSGILKTKFRKNSGWTDSNIALKFYYSYNDSLEFIPKRISKRDLNRQLPPSTLVIGQYGYSSLTLNNTEVLTLTYEVDSLKNTGKVDHFISTEIYKNAQ